MFNRWLLFRGLLQPWSRQAARRRPTMTRRFSDPTGGRFTRFGCLVSLRYNSIAVWVGLIALAGVVVEASA